MERDKQTEPANPGRRTKKKRIKGKKEKENHQTGHMERKNNASAREDD
jgi:hypothetical protein